MSDFECDNDDESMEYVYEDDNSVAKEDSSTTVSIDDDDDGMEKLNSYVFVDEIKEQKDVVVCPQCTLENSPSSLNCAACELPLPLVVDSGEEATSDLRLRQQQEAADHELALQTAMRMESGVDTDLQNLISGNFLPTTSRSNLANSQAAVTNRVFRHADVIEEELKTIADSLRSEKVANVVKVIPRAVLFQYLTRYEEQQAGNTPKLGIYLTSRPVDEVLEHVIAAEHKYSCTPILPMNASINASGGQARLDPSRQIGFQNEPSEFVWLVLYMHPTQAMIRGDHLSERDSDSTYAVRDREEEFWTQVRGLIPDACNRHDVVIPLLCTANANFRRPNNRVLQRPLHNRGVRVGGNDDDTNRVYSDRYWTAYQRFSNTVLAEMLPEQHVGLPQYVRPSE